MSKLGDFQFNSFKIMYFANTGKHWGDPEIIRPWVEFTFLRWKIIVGRKELTIAVTIIVILMLLALAIKMKRRKR